MVERHNSNYIYRENVIYCKQTRFVQAYMTLTEILWKENPVKTTAAQSEKD